MTEKIKCGKCERDDFARKQNRDLHEQHCKGKDNSKKDTQQPPEEKTEEKPTPPADPKPEEKPEEKEEEEYDLYG